MAKRWVVAARTFDVPGLVTVPGLGPDADAADGTGIPGVTAVDSSRRLLLRASYLDAPDLRLTRSGVLLRHASGDGPPHWHLTLAGEEISVPGPATTVPVELADLLIPWLRDGELRPVASLRTERIVTQLRGPLGEILAELVDDGVAVLEGRRVAVKHRELTVRPGPEPDPAAYDGDAPVPDVAVVLSDVARRLAAAGAVEGPLVSPVTRALGSRVHGAADVPAPVPLRPASPAADVVAHSLRTGVTKLLAADTAVRLDRPDGVHQMRVSCRRLRSDLGTFAALVDPEWAEPLVEDTRWLAGELGVARDLEVLRTRLASSAAADNLVPLEAAHLLRLDALLAERADAAEERVLAALHGERYRGIVHRLIAAAGAPRTTAVAEGASQAVLPPLVGAAWQRLERQAAKLHADDPDEAWHAARIKAKRARYAAEAVAPALGKKALATARAATAVQEVLGEHQDAATAADVVLALAAEQSGDGELCVTLGRLAERQRAAVLAARHAFPGVWRAAAAARVTRWTRAS